MLLTDLDQKWVSETQRTLKILAEGVIQETVQGKRRCGEIKTTIQRDTQKREVERKVCYVGVSALVSQ